MFPTHQLQDLSVFRRQRGEGSLHRSGLLDAFDEVAGFGSRGLELREERSAQPVPPADAPNMIGDNSPGDSVEPQSGFVICWHIVDAPPSRQEHLGNDVGCVRGRRAAPGRVTKDEPPMLSIQLSQPYAIIHLGHAVPCPAEPPALQANPAPESAIGSVTGRRSLTGGFALRQAVWRKPGPARPVCGIPAALYSDDGADLTSDYSAQVCAG